MKKLISTIAGGLILAAGTQTSAAVDFDKQVKPLLEAKCINCHAAPYKSGTRTKKPKAGLRIDTRENLLKGSDDNKVVKIGDAANSLFYERTILPADHDDIMPPKGDPLTAGEKAVLKEWIDSGLKWSAGVVLKRQE
jgi:uncharacterized membrane protein